MSEFLDSIVRYTYDHKNKSITSHCKMFFEIYETRISNGPLRDYHYSYINCWDKNEELSDFWLYARYVVMVRQQTIHHNIKIKKIIMNIKELVNVDFIELCKTIYYCTPSLFCGKPFLPLCIILDIFFYLSSLGYHVKEGIIHKNQTSINSNFIKHFECNQIINQQIKEIVKTLI